MKLTFLRGDCNNGRQCPSVNLSDRETWVIQGFTVTESVVEIPLALIPEIAHQRTLGADLHLTDRSTILVRGEPVTDAEALSELNLPTGESAVEVPLHILPAEVIARAQ